MAGNITRMRYFHYRLAVVLAFAGIKRAVTEWLSIPPRISAGLILAVVTTAVLASAGCRRSN
jgi:hypothetical protein